MSDITNLDTDSDLEGIELDPQTIAEVQSAIKAVKANPDMLPEQFGGDFKKWLKSYIDTKGTLTRTQQELAELRKAQETNVEAEETDDVTSDDNDDIISLTDDTPDDDNLSDEFNLEDYAEEFIRLKGDLSQATRESIIKKYKVSPDIVNLVVNAKRAEMVEAKAHAANVVGGSVALENLIKWVKENKSVDERRQLENDLAGPQRDYILLGLKDAAIKAGVNLNGEPVITPKGGNGGGNSEAVTPFTSKAEIQTAINDPRYRTDPAYRTSVEARLQASATGRG